MGFCAGSNCPRLEAVFTISRCRAWDRDDWYRVNLTTGESLRVLVTATDGEISYVCGYYEGMSGMLCDPGMGLGFYNLMLTSTEPTTWHILTAIPYWPIPPSDTHYNMTLVKTPPSLPGA